MFGQLTLEGSPEWTAMICSLSILAGALILLGISLFNRRDEP